MPVSACFLVALQERLTVDVLVRADGRRHADLRPLSILLQMQVYNYHAGTIALHVFYMFLRGNCECFPISRQFECIFSICITDAFISLITIFFISSQAKRLILAGKQSVAKAMWTK